MNIITENIRLLFPMNFPTNSPGFFNLRTYSLIAYYWGSLTRPYTLYWLQGSHGDHIIIYLSSLSILSLLGIACWPSDNPLHPSRLMAVLHRSLIYPLHICYMYISAKNWKDEGCSSFAICHLSTVSCHLLPVTCHLASVFLSNLVTI